MQKFSFGIFHEHEIEFSSFLILKILIYSILVDGLMFIYGRFFIAI